MTGEPETKTSQLQMLPCVSLLTPPPPLSFSLLIVAYYRAGAAPTCTFTHTHTTIPQHTSISKKKKKERKKEKILLCTQPRVVLYVCGEISSKVFEHLIPLKEK